MELALGRYQIVGVNIRNAAVSAGMSRAVASLPEDMCGACLSAGDHAIAVASEELNATFGVSGEWPFRFPRALAP